MAVSRTLKDEFISLIIISFSLEQLLKNFVKLFYPVSRRRSNLVLLCRPRWTMDENYELTSLLEQRP